MITLEAMSAGLPVVATNRGALPELIENNRTGLLVEYNSYKIAEVIVNVINNKEKSNKLGKNAKQYISNNNFDENQIGKVWEELMISQIKS